MKILCFADNHFCEKSSIITKYGTNYTSRLENQIKSLNWVEDMAYTHGCSCVICLGDFFDRPFLTSQEITALNEIKWGNIPHYFLVGNHESEENDLQYSSTNILNKNNHYIINEPTTKYVGEGVELAFLPYIVESNRRPISEYFNKKESGKLRFLVSHNDILGIQLGPVVSKTGFSTDDLESISDICINGHLHNGLQITKGVINLGNLTGKDFSEDATKYSHKVLIFDTDFKTCEYIENPYAFNFYKLEVNSKEDLLKLDMLKANAVVSIKCKDTLLLETKEKLNALSNVVESRLILIKDVLETTDTSVDASSLMVDQCAKFAECCRAKLDNTEVLEVELAEILK